MSKTPSGNRFALAAAAAAAVGDDVGDSSPVVAAPSAGTNRCPTAGRFRATDVSLWTTPRPRPAPTP
jgi:hypothetical protein